MRNLKTPGLILLLALVLAYGLLKVYVYFSVKSQADELVARVRPFAELSYSGISSNLLDGRVALEGIEARTSERAFPLRIGSLAVQGPGLGFLMDVASGLEGGEPPSWMRLMLRRMELPDIHDLMPAAMLAALPATPTPEPCSLGDLLGRAGLHSSERYPMSLDVDARYEINAALRNARIEFRYDIQGGESVSLEMSLGNMQQPGSLMAGVLPTLERFSYAYQPNVELVQGLVSECAAAQSQSKADFVAALLQQSEKDLLRQLGMVPGPGLASALQSFLLSPGEVLIVAGPIDDVSRLQHSHLTPEQWVALLEPRLSLNGKRVQDLSFRSQARTQGRAGDPSGADAQAAKAAERPRPAYFKTPVAQLHKYIGRNVHLLEKGHAEPHSGVLVSVSNDEVSVQKRIHGGKFTVHTPFKQVSHIEVWRYAEPIE